MVYSPWGSYQNKPHIEKNIISYVPLICEWVYKLHYSQNSLGLRERSLEAQNIFPSLSLQLTLRGSFTSIKLLPLMWRLRGAILLVLADRGGLKKPKTEKNQQPNRIETEKKNQTETAKPNRTKSAQFGFDFRGPKTEPDRTEPKKNIYIYINTQKLCWCQGLNPWPPG